MYVMFDSADDSRHILSTINRKPDCFARYLGSGGRAGATPLSTGEVKDLFDSRIPLLPIYNNASPEHLTNGYPGGMAIANMAVEMTKALNIPIVQDTLLVVDIEHGWEVVPWFFGGWADGCLQAGLTPAVYCSASDADGFFTSMRNTQISVDKIQWWIADWISVGINYTPKEFKYKDGLGSIPGERIFAWQFANSPMIDVSLVTSLKNFWRNTKIQSAINYMKQAMEILQED